MLNAVSHCWLHDNNPPCSRFTNSKSRSHSYNSRLRWKVPLDVLSRKCASVFVPVRSPISTSNKSSNTFREEALRFTAPLGQKYKATGFRIKSTGQLHLRPTRRVVVFPFCACTVRFKCILPSQLADGGFGDATSSGGKPRPSTHTKTSARWLRQVRVAVPYQL